MFTFFFWLYNTLFIPLLVSGAYLARFFNTKIADGLAGRRSLFKNLERDLQKVSSNQPRVWFHVSSMGEFEQVKPVIAQLKKEHSHAVVVLSFFSPSGYNHANAWPHKDVVCYLPVDTFRRAKKFIRLVRPSCAVIVRHDIWPNHMWRLKRQGIPALLIDASIPEARFRTFKRYAFFLNPLYSFFDQVLVISQKHKERFQTVFPYPRRIFNCGDSRYDQVFRRANETDKISRIAQKGAFQRQHCFIAGSTWPSDEKKLLAPVCHFLQKDSKHRAIIAPHEINRKHIEALESYLNDKNINTAVLSRLDYEETWTFQVLIIDRIGLLANLYAFADLAYVGGGFGPGVHNVLEPAAHGCAVAFGPRHLNSDEAVALIEAKGAVLVKGEAEIESLLHRFDRDFETVKAGGNGAFRFVEKNLGASICTVDKIAEYIAKKR